MPKRALAENGYVHYAPKIQSDPLDSFAVHDPKVTHFVSPITKPEGHPGDSCERCMVLVDFSPTVQKI